MRPMPLAARLQCFFLGALAVVLLTFSAVILLAVRAQLRSQMDERLAGVMAALVASVETHQEGLEWELQNRLLQFGPGPQPEPVHWAVYDESGTLVDHSNHLDGILPWTPAPQTTNGIEMADVQWRDGAWRSAGETMSHPRVRSAGRGVTSEGAPLYGAMHLSAALPLRPIADSLWSLTGFLSALSMGIWVICALTGKYLCRRALEPLREMAASMEHIPIDQPALRLPLRNTGDEIDVLALAFNTLLARFQEAYSHQQRFAADASHQLRTPLTVMLGHVDVALRRDRSEENYRRVLELVRRRILEIQHIIEALLLLARGRQNAQILEVSTINLQEFIPQLVSRRADSFRFDDLRHRLADDAPLVVQAHEQLLEQALGNLIDNATRYSPAKTSIVLSAARHAGQIEISVEDRGQGINDADLPRIFEPFFRGTGELEENSAGVGLGLAVAKRIAEYFGGSLRAEQVEAGGTRFVLALPDAQPAPASVPFHATSQTGILMSARSDDQISDAATPRDFLVNFRVRITALVCLLAFAAGFILHVRPHDPFGFQDRLGMTGALFVLLGLGIRSWAAGILRKGREVTATGPYRMCRHPLYLGSLLMVAGTLMLYPGPLVGAAAFGLIVILLRFTIDREEERLAVRFGQPWADYVRATPLRLVPCRIPQVRGEWSWDQWARNREYNALIAVIGGAALLRLWLSGLP